MHSSSFHAHSSGNIIKAAAFLAADGTQKAQFWLGFYFSGIKPLQLSQAYVWKE
jgi:hypothetical protein